jgi:hypothetical protein
MLDESTKLQSAVTCGCLIISIVLNGSTEIPTPPASQATQAPTTDECSSISNASSEAVDKGQQAPTSEEISPPKLNDELVEEFIVAAAKSEDPPNDTSSPKITSEQSSQSRKRKLPTEWTVERTVTSDTESDSDSGLEQPAGPMKKQRRTEGLDGKRLLTWNAVKKLRSRNA